jgi:histidine triad (HIT) family protein
MRLSFFLLLVCAPILLSAQSIEFKQNKAKKLLEKSPFQDEIDGKFPDRILYQDAEVVAVKSFSPQLPKHVLIFPKKRIPTLNDLSIGETSLIAKMVTVAIKLAKQMGIAETGYRLAINTNEDAGQTSFHIHMHLLGGHKTGAMVEQTWRNKTDKPSASFLRDIENIKKTFSQYHNAWLQNNPDSVLFTFAKDAVIMPSGQLPKKGIEELRKFWFPTNGSVTTVTTVTKFDYTIDELKLDLNTAFVRSSAILSYVYENNGEKTSSTNNKQVYSTYLERQADDSWKVVIKMWNSIQ